jgi:hypothetical protein
MGAPVTERPCAAAVAVTEALAQGLTVGSIRRRQQLRLEAEPDSGAPVGLKARGLSWQAWAEETATLWAMRAGASDRSRSGRNRGLPSMSERSFHHPASRSSRVVRPQAAARQPGEVRQRAALGLEDGPVGARTQEWTRYAQEG